MSRYYGIGGGSQAQGVLDGFRQGVDRRDVKEDRDRKHVREDETLRGAIMRNDHELSAEERRGENHGLDVERKGIALEQGQENLSESRNQNQHSDLNRSAEADTLGIRTDAVKSNAQTQIDRNSSEDRLRGDKELTQRSNNRASRVQNNLSNLVSASETRQLSAQEQQNFNTYSMREQQDVFRSSLTDPETAARMINDSAIMDVDDAHTVKIEGDKWRVYNKDGELSIDQETGEPVEWNLSELQNQFGKVPKPVKGVGSKNGKASSYNRVQMQKAVENNLVGQYGYEALNEMDNNERVEFGKIAADAEKLLRKNPDMTISEGVDYAKHHRALREKHGISMDEIQAYAESQNIDVSEAMKDMIAQAQGANNEQEGPINTPAPNQQAPGANPIQEPVLAPATPGTQKPITHAGYPR